MLHLVACAGQQLACQTKLLFPRPAGAHPLAVCLIGLELPRVAQAIWPLVLPMPMQQTPAEGATVSVAAEEHCSAPAMKQAIAISFSLIAVCCHLSIQSGFAAVECKLCITAQADSPPEPPGRRLWVKAS